MGSEICLIHFDLIPFNDLVLGLEIVDQRVVALWCQC